MTPRPSACRVTVLSCSYNRAPYIADCANSILSQKFEDWEWLIHDDGSTDGTYEYLQTLKDPRIHLRRGEHRGYEGVVGVHNELLKEAQGEWIAFIDSDDMWMPGRLEKQLPGLDDPSVVMSHSDIWMIDSKGRFRRRLRPHTDPAVLTNQPPGRAAIEALAALNFPAFATPSMVRRSALLKVGGFVPGAALWDYSLFLNLSLLGSFHYLPQPLACWRRHGGQITMTSERITRQYRAHRDFANNFLLQHDGWFKQQGFDTSAIHPAQQKMLNKIEATESLMRAHSFLDMGEWEAARQLYWNYLIGALSEKKQSKKIYFIPALVGLASSLSRFNGVRWGTALRDSLMKL